MLGSGTSSGVPTIGCTCEVCQSDGPARQTPAPSILIRYGGRNVVVDTSPDFRAQACAPSSTGSMRFCTRIRTPITSWAWTTSGPSTTGKSRRRRSTELPETLEAIQRVFRYAFDEEPTQSSVPKLNLRPLDGAPFDLFGMEFTPIRLCHGKGTALGFRFGRAAYLTDHSEIPEESRAKLGGLDVLFLDALRHRPHPTHSTVEQSAANWWRNSSRSARFSRICATTCPMRAPKPLARACPAGV